MFARVKARDVQSSTPSRIEANAPVLRRLDRFEIELSGRLAELNRAFSDSPNRRHDLPNGRLLARVVLATAVTAATITVGAVTALKLLGRL